MLNELQLIDMTKPASGGGGGGTDNYNDLTNRPKINNTTLAGNKTSAQLGLVGDVQIGGTSILSSGVANLTSANLATPVRAIAPACTTITGTTATITANSTYASTVNASGCVFTLTTPSDLTVYSGFILLLDTTNSASIAFSTDGSPATSIVISGNPTLATGKKYTVTGQYSILNNAWELWIIEYKGA